MDSQKTNLREEMQRMVREGWVVWWGEGCGGKKKRISTGAADFGVEQHQRDRSIIVRNQRSESSTM